jgi:hypothetical protein
MPHLGKWVHTKPGYKQVGVWGFDRDRLWSKVDTTPDANGCHNAKSAMSPSGALMGAWKRKDGVMIQQMTQIRRLVQMDITDKDLNDHQVTLSCRNQRCCNPKHFVLRPTNKPRSK